MRMWLKDLFARSMPPTWVDSAREIANILPARVRYGKSYDDALSLLLAGQQWDEEEILRYQEKQLEILLAHCYRHVPFYRNWFNERGLSHKDIQSLDDLKKLPIIDKQVLRESGSDFVADNAPFFNTGTARTSGSTGAPLTLIVDESARAFERALSALHLLWLRQDASDRIAYLNPRPVSRPSRLVPLVSRSNELRLTFRAMDDNRMARAVQLLQRFKPDIISAWPSSLYMIARWMKRHGKKLQSPRFLVTSSENLYPHVRSFLEEFFQARLSDYYGQEESVVFAMQCENPGPYHLQMLLGIPELLPKGNDQYEVVGTGLHNFAMPLLRYRTGDLVQSNESECQCGRSFADIGSIGGRESEFIVTPENKVVSPLLLNYCFHDLDEVREAQLIQEERNLLRVLVVPWQKISPETSQALLSSIRSTLETDSMNIMLEQADKLCENEGCKTPFIMSSLKLRDSLGHSS